jgi:glycosyltransferase involved in cell wall biosynthesis
VVATSEVGAVEDLDRSVVEVVQPGDVEAMATAITALLERLRAYPAKTRSVARAEAERLFAPDVVCAQISDALETLVDGARSRRPAIAREHREPSVSGHPRRS